VPPGRIPCGPKQQPRPPSSSPSAGHHAETDDYRARTRLSRSGRPDPELTPAVARQRPVRRNGTERLTKTAGKGHDRQMITQRDVRISAQPTDRRFRAVDGRGIEQRTARILSNSVAAHIRLLPVRVSHPPGQWRLDVRPRAQRQLTRLPENIAAAAASSLRVRSWIIPGVLVIHCGTRTAASIPVRRGVDSCGSRLRLQSARIGHQTTRRRRRGSRTARCGWRSWGARRSSGSRRRCRR
jgi:hypothetical protein